MGKVQIDLTKIEESILAQYCSCYNMKSKEAGIKSLLNRLNVCMGKETDDFILSSEPFSFFKDKKFTKEDDGKVAYFG